MSGSDKLYWDLEFPLENVNVDKLKQVFKLVEIEVSGIEGLKSSKRLLNFEKDKSYYKKYSVPPRFNSNNQNRWSGGYRGAKVSDSEKQSSSTKKMNVPLDFYEKLEKQTSTPPGKKYVPKKEQPSGQPPKNEFFLYKEVEELPRSISRWIMDSGASMHMTGRKALLYDVRGFNDGYVGFAECLILKTGFVIPEEWIIMRAPRVSDLYVVDMSVATTTTGQTHCFMSRATQKESELWHRKMGHIHLRKMNHLVHNDLVKGVHLKSFHLEGECISCIKGKQRKKFHPCKKMNSVSKLLERLHMDLFGPVNVKSITGCLYCLVVTDDYSRFSWVTFLKTKDETFESLLRLFRKIENLYRTRIQRLRSDNGTEFKNNKMGEFCDRRGILQEFSAPYTPQQNGVAERKNRTLIETARTMLVDSKLPVNFWAEAVSAACYTLNRLEEEPEFFDDLDILREYEASQGRFPERSSRRQRQISNDNEACPSNTGENDEVQQTPTTSEREPAPENQTVVNDNSESDDIPTIDHGDSESEGEQIQSSNQTILDNEQVADQNVTNLEGEVDVPGEVMPRTLSYHPEELIIGELQSGVRTRRQIDHDLTCFYTKVSPLQTEFSLTCFISQIESRTYKEALAEDSWVIAMQEELSQFEKLGVWKLVDLPDGHRKINTKWVFKCKRDDRGVIVRNKARLVVQGFSQQEGIDFTEIYVDDIIFGSTNEELCKGFEKVMKQKFEMSSMGEMNFFLGLQVDQMPEGTFIHQTKYVHDVLEKFGMSGTAPMSTPLATNHGINPDLTGEKVDETLYRSMIGSLMYLTASRPDIMYPTCLTARYQSSPRASHMSIVRRILRYLKGTPSLGLWYPNDGDFTLEGYSGSDFGCCKVNVNQQLQDANFSDPDWSRGNLLSNAEGILGVDENTTADDVEKQTTLVLCMSASVGP
ncbi:uncharacterized protein LOC118491109 [Helianthus annuus]|uniref:uncharacterized protein LOC118491109 n=1 Tax=Helianthus annuus TaxID=4232 RepID=UPI0016533EB5|nr:uncharacterized protein LOC118491109 [Helianthus annuus]